ncbi:MAG: branched-chain amino acid ABC transporter permease, partial [Actinomycetota bacterium]
MELFFNQLVNGISAGSIYAALALALVLIFRSTGLLNFAQGEMAMFSAFIAWQFNDAGLSMPLAIVASMAISFVGGAVIERTIIRPVGNDNLLAIVIITIGLFIFLNALAGWIYGTDGRNFPSPFPSDSWSVGGVNITADDIGNLLVLGAVVVVLFFLFQHDPGSDPDERGRLAVGGDGSQAEPELGPLEEEEEHDDDRTEHEEVADDIGN